MFHKPERWCVLMFDVIFDILARTSIIIVLDRPFPQYFSNQNPQQLTVIKVKVLVVLRLVDVLAFETRKDVRTSA